MLPPFTRTKLSMHVQHICMCWGDPRKRDDTSVGDRVDSAHMTMSTWAQWHAAQAWASSNPPSRKRK